MSFPSPHPQLSLRLVADVAPPQDINNKARPLARGNPSELRALPMRSCWNA